MTSPSTGFLHLTLNDTYGSCGRGTGLKGRKTLSAPPGNFIVMSVSDFVCSCPQYLEVYSQDQGMAGKRLWHGCDHESNLAHVLESSIVTIQWDTVRSCKRDPGCLTVYFSFHQKMNLPPKLSSGLYNCSVSDYWRFQHHLNCDLEVHCEDGRDETEHCPYTSPACQGRVAVRDKCYVLPSQKIFDTYLQTERKLHTTAIKVCASLNASLAKFRGTEDAKTVLHQFEKIPMKYKFPSPVSGVSYGSLSVPSLYRRSLVQYDKTVFHHPFTAPYTYTGKEICFTMSTSHIMSAVLLLSYWTCSMDSKRFLDTFRKPPFRTICEVAVHDSSQNQSKIIHLFKDSSSFQKRNSSISLCPNGQAAHMFLSCHPHYACGQGLAHLCIFSNSMKNSIDSYQEAGHLMSLALFTCNDDVTMMSYTLVCDFRHHCKDGSDETFCQHPPCDAHACSNGQCVPYIKRCDIASDCLDDSDELDCMGYIKTFANFSEIKYPVLISFDGRLPFATKKMNPNESCPETHYRCPGEYNDCLPVYTRCNGWYDCMVHEDEEACENMTCPGFYRCFNSTVCAHAKHLCDGWPHCPQQDDEWLCNFTCPSQCLCQGYAFLCSQSVSAYMFPYLRYLDARGSGMKPSDLNNNHYLIHLSLSGCSLNTLPAMTFLNLQFLDVSANNLTIVSMTAFSHLLNLRTLSLAKNPISLIHCDPDSTVQLSALRRLDMSHNQLSGFDSKVLSVTSNVQVLNLSFSIIHTIHPNGFWYTPKLTHLYLAGNPIKTFSADLFKPLKNLRTLSSGTFKLCCREFLPDHFELITCRAPKDEISSCEDLLQSGIYRVFLWLISLLSLLSNFICLVVRICVQSTASFRGYHVFVTNLSIADFLMGVYLAIIGTADSLFLGKYLSHDESWKHGVACKVAGVLSLLSCEVSALTIWLITLDRFIVLHFPFSSVRFQGISATVTCVITWLVGCLLALVPLLPVASHWEFFSQTGICIPLPVTRHDFSGKVYSLGVFIVFNFFLFVLIAAGQAFIYWSVQKNALVTDSSKLSRDVTIARRLISVAVTDFLCWFPIGLCGLLALANIPIPREMNVAFAIFVLPLNSALNPFMYTLNMLMEKRRKSREAMLLQWLESKPDFL